MKTLIYILAVMMAGSVGAASFTIGAGTGPEADMTAISGVSFNTNFGTGTSHFVDLDNPFRVFINWPALKDSLYGRTADSGFIQIKTTTNICDADCDFVVYQVRQPRDWVETEATWNIWKTSNNWTTAGCGSTTSDRYNTAIASWSLEPTINTYRKFYITPYLKDMDGNDTANCRGLIILQTTGAETYGAQYYSDDNATSTNRPKITVYYHEGIDATGVPPRRRRDGAWLWPRPDEQEQFAIEIKEKRSCVVQ